jgi:hypothetical protein
MVLWRKKSQLKLYICFIDHFQKKIMKATFTVFKRLKWFFGQHISVSPVLCKNFKFSTELLSIMCTRSRFFLKLKKPSDELCPSRCLSVCLSVWLVGCQFTYTLETGQTISLPEGRRHLRWLEKRWLFQTELKHSWFTEQCCPWTPHPQHRNSLQCLDRNLNTNCIHKIYVQDEDLKSGLNNYLHSKLCSIKENKTKLHNAKQRI